MLLTSIILKIILVGDFVDGTAPTASLATTDLTKQLDSNIPANFTVNFSDNVGIDAASIGAQDITVTAPDGTVLPTFLTGINNDSNGQPESATYYFDAPGGTWDAADIGDYTGKSQTRMQLRILAATYLLLLF